MKLYRVFTEIQSLKPLNKDKANIFHLVKMWMFSVPSSRQKRDQKIGAILVMMVVVFITCNLPRVILNVYEVCTSHIHYSHEYT